MKKNIYLLVILILIAIGPAAGAPVRGQSTFSLYLPALLNIIPNPFGIAVASTSTQDGYDRAREAGASWLRLDVSWEAIEPSQGQRNWASVAGLEVDLQRARNDFFNPLLIIGGTPAWAEDGGFPCGGRIRPDKLNAFAAFAADLVARFSVSPYNVYHWELWNEPDVFGGLGCWGASGDQFFGGAYYGEMLKVVYPRIKAVNPNVRVMVGGLLMDCDPASTATNCVNSPSQTRFFEGILASGAGSAFDGVSFHAYDYYDGVSGFDNLNWFSSSTTNGTVQLNKAAYLRSKLNQYGVSGKFLMNTEVGLLWSGATPTPAFETVKAYYVPQAYAAAMADGYAATIWYSAFGDRNSGLIAADLTPRPAFYAYQYTTGKLLGAAYQRRIGEFTGVDGYSFRMRSGKILWILWAKNPASPVPINLTSIPSKVDKIGTAGTPEAVVPSQAINVGAAPLFIEF